MILRPLLRVALVAAGLAQAAPAAARQAPPLAPADLSRLSPSDFRDDELDLPYYLAHFHRLANAVRMSGEDRGFIDLPVWRRPEDNRPYNARIMENLTSLAFFYATDRPWNPYHGHPALRARLEAALDFWVRSQSPDGRFSEYGDERWSLAPTAFATKFMGETLRLLRGGPPVDAALLSRVAAADRRAIVAVLTRPDLYEHGRRFSNQFGNVWPGALAYLALYPDPEVERLLRAQLERARPDHLSPVGYFYEADGPDWGYNLGTHHSNVHMAWHLSRGTEIGRGFEEETRRWYEWLALNAVPEPDGTGFVLNRGIETRQQEPFVTGAGQLQSGYGNPLAEVVPGARVLGPTREQREAELRRRRAQLTRDWPRVDPLVPGEFSAYSPYAFLHRTHAVWHPTEEQRREAIARMPFLARDRFVHQRVDTRRPVAFTFVRRPRYYAAFNSGEIITAQQRYGLGLLWTPAAGALLQSQTGTADEAWGTRAAAAAAVYEARTFTPELRVDGRPAPTTPGNRDLPDGEPSVHYRLGEAGTKSLTFGDTAVGVSVEHAGDFTEQIPLLVLPTDRIERAPGRVELRRGGERLLLRFDPAAVTAAVRTTDLAVGAKRVAVVTLRASGSLRYSLALGPAPAGQR